MKEMPVNMREFNLTKEQTKILMISNCYYCGCLPSQIENVRGTNEPFIYNGIDRKDNDIGYILNNCVTCCGECNWIKGSMSHERFILKAKQIANNHRESDEKKS